MAGLFEEEAGILYRYRMTAWMQELLPRRAINSRTASWGKVVGRPLPVNFWSRLSCFREMAVNLYRTGQVAINRACTGARPAPVATRC